MGKWGWHEERECAGLAAAQRGVMQREESQFRWGGGAVATELRNECRRTLARPLHLWVGDTRRYNKQIWDKEKRSSLDCWVLAVLHWALRNAQLTGADWWLPSCYTLSQLSLCNSRCFPHTMLFLRSCVLGCIQMYFCCPPLSSAVLCCPAFFRMSWQWWQAAHTHAECSAPRH